MSSLTQVIAIVGETLQIESSRLEPDTLLMGSIPEFDSMAVVSILTAIEENLGIFVDDDEIDATVFESITSLVNFVDQKLAA